MAVSEPGQVRIHRLARFGLTTADAVALAAFFETALGFRRIASERFSGMEFRRLMGVEGGAESIKLGLGSEIVELLQFDRPGRPYPPDTLASDLIFQHFAVVAADIRQAYERLCAAPGWRAISADGPERLPAASGHVTAFKFRDPDGHPLELLGFPTGAVPSQWRARPGGDSCLGIDHSAISVADTAGAVAFYERLGLRATTRSNNVGPEQGRLDGLSEPRVDVTTLSPAQETPHVELLCYRSVAHGSRLQLRNNDIAATRLVLEAGDRAPARGLTDIDGHHVQIVSATGRPEYGAART